MLHEKIFTNKAQLFFWFLVGDIKITDIFYKIQKFLKTSFAPIFTTKGINILMEEYYLNPGHTGSVNNE